VRLLPAGHELVGRLVDRIADLDTDPVAGLTPRSATSSTGCCAPCSTTWNGGTVPQP
jgi:hypothetical protein